MSSRHTGEEDSGPFERREGEGERGYDYTGPSQPGAGDAGGAQGAGAVARTLGVVGSEETTDGSGTGAGGSGRARPEQE